MGALRDLKVASGAGLVNARVRPPARCLAEAQRVIEDLGLAGYVELVEPAGRQRARGFFRRRPGAVAIAHEVQTA